MDERVGQCSMRHERNVRSLVTSVCEINARGGFGRPAHSHEHDIGMLEVLGQLAVVAHHAKVKRVDPLEIIGVEHVLRASPRRRVLTEIGLNKVKIGPKDGEAWRS